MATPIFPLCVILLWALANSSCIPNLKSLASAVAEILKGNLKILGSSPSSGHAHFSSWCDFMMGLGKHKQHTKFEFANFSRCRNIKGEPKNFKELPSPRPCPLFLLSVILWWALANPSCAPNLKSLASVVAKILKGDSKILWSFPSPGFYEKPHFTIDSFNLSEPVKWGLKIFEPNYQKAHPYAKSDRTNRLPNMAVTLFWH